MFLRNVVGNFNRDFVALLLLDGNTLGFWDAVTFGFGVAMLSGLASAILKWGKRNRYVNVDCWNPLAEKMSFKFNYYANATFTQLVKLP